MTTDDNFTLSCMEKCRFYSCQMTTSGRHGEIVIGCMTTDDNFMLSCMEKCRFTCWQMTTSCLHGEIVIGYMTTDDNFTLSCMEKCRFCVQKMSLTGKILRNYFHQKTSRDFSGKMAVRLSFDGLNFYEIDSLRPTPKSKLPIMVTLDHKIPFQMDQMIQQCLTNRSRHPKKQLWPIFL